MRAIVIGLLLAAQVATAQAIEFTEPVRVGTGAGAIYTLAVASGPADRVAFVARGTDEVHAGVRSAGGAWDVRRIRSASVMGQPQIAFDGSGAATVVLTKGFARSFRREVVTLRAAPGGGFGRQRTVASTNFGSPAVLAASPAGGATIVTSDRSRPCEGCKWTDNRFMTISMAGGKVSRPRPLGVGGGEPLLAATDGGYVLAYLAGVGGSCLRGRCPKRPLMAVRLDREGRRIGRPVMVTDDGTSGSGVFGSPRVSAADGRVVFSWIGRSRSAYTRTFDASSLRPTEPARRFPDNRMPPAVVPLPGGGLAGVGASGGLAVRFAPARQAWADLAPVPEQLSDATPGLVALGADRALAVGATADLSTAPTSRTISAEEWTPAGRTATTDIATGVVADNLPTRLAAAATPAGKVVVAWPAPGGGVAVAESR